MHFLHLLALSSFALPIGAWNPIVEVPRLARSIPTNGPDYELQETESEIKERTADFSPQIMFDRVVEPDAPGEMCAPYKIPLCMTLIDPNCEEANPYSKPIFREWCTVKRCICGMGLNTTGKLGLCQKPVTCSGGQSTIVFGKPYFSDKQITAKPK